MSVEDIVLGEAAAEVALGGRVGDAAGAGGVEVDLVVAPSLDVFEASPASEEIEGDVQDVVGFVVGVRRLRRWRSRSMSRIRPVLCAAGARRRCRRVRGLGLARRAHSGCWWRRSWAGRVRAQGRFSMRSAILLPTLPEDPAVAAAGLVGVAFAADLGDSGSHSRNLEARNSEDVYEPPLFRNYRGFQAFRASDAKAL